MAHMYVAFLLEFYQPPTQEQEVLNSIVRECYLPLGHLFNSSLNPKFTISLTNSLVGLLERFGWKDRVLQPLQTANQKGQLEVIHSGAYHPVFPLFPIKEVQRQIELDIELKQSIFQTLDRTGIIAPDHSYTDDLLNLYRQMGFKWTVINDSAMGFWGIDVSDHQILQVDGFSVLLRSSFWSDDVIKKRSSGRFWTGKEFVQHLQDEIAHRDRDCYKLLSLTAETFGHHIRYFQETFLRDMLFALADSGLVTLCTISELIATHTLQKVEKRQERGRDFIYFPQSSIATHADSLARGDRFPHWQSAGNAVHSRLWALTNLILEACGSIDFSNRHHRDLREMLDRAFFSGQYFSASVWYWDPKTIFEGIDLQMRALYKYYRVTGDNTVLIEGQRIYTELMWEIDQETLRRSQ